MKHLIFGLAPLPPTSHMRKQVYVRRQKNRYSNVFFCNTSYTLQKPMRPLTVPSHCWFNHIPFQFLGRRRQGRSPTPTSTSSLETCGAANGQHHHKPRRSRVAVHMGGFQSKAEELLVVRVSLRGNWTHLHGHNPMWPARLVKPLHPQKNPPFHLHRSVSLTARSPSERLREVCPSQNASSSDARQGGTRWCAITAVCELQAGSDQQGDTLTHEKKNTS